MVRSHTLRFLLAALALVSAILPARALQLGESKAQILERHGVPGAEDRGKNVAIYFWEGWSAEVEYKEESIQKLIYRRNAYLEPTEVTSLLQSNGGAAKWRETTPRGEATRQWVRDDGATATCLAVRPLMMTFQVGQRPPPPVARYGTPATPKVVVPAVPPVVSSTPPSFPKLLGSALDSEGELASEASTTAAPLSPVRSFPKLKSEEIATAPVVRRATAADDAETPQASSAAAIPPAAARHLRLRDEAAVPPAEASNSGGFGFVIALIVILGAVLGGGVYWFKFRIPRKEGSATVVNVAPRASVARYESPQPAMATTPALDALRSDQFELLVGEIFRREGYAVELSAAAAQGDSIDLTLRRDAETILVQCKYWKSSRVTEREVGEFYNAMMTNGAPRGIFVTAGTFSREAQEFAVGKEIDLMDRTALEESTAAVSRSGEDFCAITGWVEEFAAHARIFDPECPICQGSMVIRNHRANGTASWTCRNHPRCPGRREPRRDLLAVAAAH